MSQYDKSPMPHSAVAEEYAQNPDALFNDRDPQYELKRESPRHRIVILLKAQGLSNIEIAKRTEYTPVSIANILRQPWARQALLREIQAAGRDEIQGLLQSTASDSVWTLISLRDDENVESSVRRSAADSLLDRWLGKAVAKVEMKAVAATAGDIESVERELQELDREVNRLTGSSSGARSDPITDSSTIKE